MSMSYWMNEGVGIRCDDIFDHLDKHKCYLVVQEQLPDEEIDEEGFELDDFLYGDAFENIADFLCCLDDDDIFTFGDSGDGQYYFLYPPTYPWGRREKEPKSLEEVHSRIVSILLKVTDLTPQEAEALIDDDIYEYGCG